MLVTKSADVASVLRAVYLDGDPRLDAGEINDELSQRNLPPKMETLQNGTFAQPIPELDLLRGHAFPQPAGQCDWLTIFAH